MSWRVQRERNTQTRTKDWHAESSILKVSNISTMKPKELEIEHTKFLGTRIYKKEGTRSEIGNLIDYQQVSLKLSHVTTMKPGKNYPKQASTLLCSLNQN